MTQKLNLMIFFCFILISGGISTGRATDAFTVSDGFKEKAKKALPLRDESYTFMELQKIFNPILLEETEKLFNQYLSIMFEREFPRPVHPNQTIVSGWQCLYGKMAFALTIDDYEQKKELQVNSLYQLLAFHKKNIRRYNPELAEQIPDHPCDGCAKNAKKELGFLLEEDFDPYE